ncbi:MAG: PaaI family thioesterase [Immundisolibacteraceae bacterium]|nr:PaaI family thioesterase [Immundisolibacteraceae bacterium]
MVDSTKPEHSADLTFVDMDQPHTLKTFKADVETIEPGFARIRYPFKLDWCNPRGSLQGGMYGVFLDEVMGYAMIGSHPKLDTLWTTTTLNINYLRPITGEIIAEGRVIREGKRTVYVEAELITPDGKLCAKATSTMMILRRDGELLE